MGVLDGDLLQVDEARGAEGSLVQRSDVVVVKLQHLKYKLVIIEAIVNVTVFPFHSWVSKRMSMNNAAKF